MWASWGSEAVTKILGKDMQRSAIDQQSGSRDMDKMGMSMMGKAKGKGLNGMVHDSPLVDAHMSLNTPSWVGGSFAERSCNTIARCIDLIHTPDTCPLGHVPCFLSRSTSER